jgi:SpoVK/Ycf46/Vps4 family AAA+-type ATPase
MIAMSAHYESNLDYLRAELSLLDVLLRSQVTKCREWGDEGHAEISRGVFISEAEVDRMLGSAQPHAHEATQTDELLNAAARLKKEIERKRKESLKRGVYVGTSYLSRLFDLTPFEEQIVIVCLAPELDAKYAKLYAYLQDDITKRRPTVELILNTLCATPEEALSARLCFSPQASLLRARILRLADEGEAVLLARPVKLDERIVNFLLGFDVLEGAYADHVEVNSEPEAPPDLWIPDELKASLLSAAQAHLQESVLTPRKLIYQFHGAAGAGRRALAAWLCRQLQTSLAVVDVERVLRRSQDFEETMRLILREALLQPAAIYLENFDCLLGRDEQTSLRLRELARAVGEFTWLTFLATEKAWEPAGSFAKHLFLSVELPMPDMTARAEIWKTLVARDASLEPCVDVEELATKFQLTPGKIESALVAARNYAHLRAGRDAPLTTDDLYYGCRSQSNQKLSALARKLPVNYGWADITLPAGSLAQLREFCAQMRHRRTVYETWGFERQLSSHKGLSALFYGASGTGKTMAVEIIARELRLDAYKIDLSTVVSKYIGETEKNLSEIFREAETSNAILFFDEADALFGKRSEVKDAHDRYANIEINYLLQRIEEFDGMVVLATNLRKNIDEAFFRRMNFAIEFPFPEAADRYRIWKQHFPADAPLAEDIDLNFLANRINVAGGNVKNIVVNAAFLAAENSGVIHMRHLVRAASREYAKMGRTCTDAEFAPYHAMLSDASS